MTREAQDTAQRDLELHRGLHGKIAIEPRAELTPETLEFLYTPGVGAVSRGDGA